MWCPVCGAEYRDGFGRCADCEVDLVPPRFRETLPRGERETRYRDSAGPWLCAVGSVAVATASVFLIVMAFAEDPFSFLSLALGVGFAVWAWWISTFYVYDWTLTEEGLVETRTLLRRRVDEVSNLEHDKDEDQDRWLITRAGPGRRLRLSPKSGRVLANTLRARDAYDLVYDPEPPPPSPWWSKLLSRLLEGD